MEIALFGRIIKYLSYGEALYILNQENYKKSLDEFRKGFMELSYEDLVIKGQFSDYNLGNETKIKKYENTISIKAKKYIESSTPFKKIKISIPLRNDVIGRHIKEEDLEPYL